MSRKIEYYCVPSSELVEKTARNFCFKKQIEYHAVKNEYESVQLVLNSEQEFFVREIKLEMDGFDFELYWVIYHTAKKDSPQSEHFHAGEYPDALVPFNAVPEEERIVSAGNNQGIWITVHTPYKPAGVYTGKCIVRTNIEEIEIPVSLRLYDVVLEDRATFYSAFCLRYGWIPKGEGRLDQQIAESYYETCLKYRINPNILPQWSADPCAYADEVEKYYFDERVTLYGIPTDNVNFGQTHWDFPNAKPYILELAARSKPGYNLFDKSCLYFFDEPEVCIPNDTKQARMENDVLNCRRMLCDIAAEIEADQSGRYAGFKSIDGWQENIEKLRFIGTIDLTTGSLVFGKEVAIWAPSYIHFDDEKNRKKGVELAREKGDLMLWYGCLGPHYPYPTLNMPDKATASRSVFWMQKDYDIDGILYWSINLYSPFEEISKENYQIAFNWVEEHAYAGDGTLVYPGVNYGLNEPVPCIRLMSVRDGAEEYELLRQLENKYKSYVKYYGADFNYKGVLRRLYDRMYKEMTADIRSELFDEVRRDLLERLERKDESCFCIENVKLFENTATVTLRVKEGYEVFMQGKNISVKDGKGVCTFSIVRGRNFAEFIVINKETSETFTYKEWISDEFEIFAVKDIQEAGSKFLFNEGSEIFAYSFGRGLTRLAKRGVDITFIADDSGYATLDIPLEVFGDLSDVSSLSFDLYNTENRSLTIFTLLVKDGKEYKEQGKEFFRNRGLYQKVELKHLKAVTGIKDFDFLRLKIRNTYPTDTSKEMRVLINNFELCF